MWMILDRNNDLSLIRQIYNKMKEMILDGSISPLEKLPSTRALADELNVSRNTILEVYDQLIAEGYLEGHHGSGTFVAAGIQERRTVFAKEKAITLLPIKKKDEKIIDFRSGVPDLTLFPRKEWAKLYYQVCNDLPATALRYYPPAGVIELRNAISQYLYRTRGINCSAENIMIISGSTQGLSLISKLLYQDKNVVIAEDPTHPGLRKVISSIGYNMVSIEVDDHGLNSSLLKALDHISFIYTTPSHQYPLGGILPIQRRLDLIKYSIENSCYLVEDDYDSEFRFEGQPINSLYELDPDKVIYIGSFSKILAPALRLGFLILPNELITKYNSLKMYSDVHTEALSQYVLAEFIHNGGLEKHIWKMKKLYNQKRKHLLQELSVYFKDEYVIKGQAAGLHVLVHFHHFNFTEELIKRIQESCVKVYPVENYAWQSFRKHTDEILLGYAHLSLSEISKGLQILSEVIHTFNLSANNIKTTLKGVSHIMDRMRDNNATPKKDTGPKGVDNDNPFRNDAKDSEVEIEQPNPSTATPAVPVEMPAREMR